MSNKQETIADIVKEMRTLGRLDEKSTDKIPRTLQALGLRTYANRIEAAAKREVAELKRKMNDVVCENEALLDACETCGAKREREAGAEAAQICGEIGEMIGMEATREKSSQVGNTAKMREALVKAKKAICHHAKYVCQSLSWENSDIQYNCGDILCAHRDLCEAKTAINAALASPPRNCDVGTVEKQAERFRRFCETHKPYESQFTEEGELLCPSTGCELIACNYGQCALAWSQMPYKEGGAK